MTQLVESLKRLYEKSLILDEKVNTMLAEGKITQEEADYILGN